MYRYKAAFAAERERADTQLRGDVFFFLVLLAGRSCVDVLRPSQYPRHTHICTHHVGTRIPQSCVDVYIHPPLGQHAPYIAMPMGFVLRARGSRKARERTRIKKREANEGMGESTEVRKAKRTKGQHRCIVPVHCCRALPLASGRRRTMENPTTLPKPQRPHASGPTPQPVAPPANQRPPSSSAISKRRASPGSAGPSQPLSLWLVFPFFSFWPWPWP